MDDLFVRVFVCYLWYPYDMCWTYAVPLEHNHSAVSTAWYIQGLDRQKLHTLLMLYLSVVLFVTTYPDDSVVTCLVVHLGLQAPSDAASHPPQQQQQEEQQPSMSAPQHSTDYDGASSSSQQHKEDGSQNGDAAAEDQGSAAEQQAAAEQQPAGVLRGFNNDSVPLHNVG